LGGRARESTRHCRAAGATNATPYLNGQVFFIYSLFSGAEPCSWARRACMCGLHGISPAKITPFKFYSQIQFEVFFLSLVSVNIGTFLKCCQSALAANDGRSEVRGLRVKFTSRNILCFCELKGQGHEIRIG